HPRVAHHDRTYHLRNHRSHNFPDTGIAARGQVYADPTDGELTSVSTSNLAVPNAKFATGNYDSNKIAEITILERSM
ncbi:MAG: hypothetical protein IJI59_15830, partial [Clostridia bacterium]|nr:hypothetical protein [Clostridia bacterium]